MEEGRSASPPLIILDCAQIPVACIELLRIMSEMDDEKRHKCIYEVAQTKKLYAEFRGGKDDSIGILDGDPNHRSLSGYPGLLYPSLRSFLRSMY